MKYVACILAGIIVGILACDRFRLSNPPEPEVGWSKWTNSSPFSHDGMGRACVEQTRCNTNTGIVQFRLSH